MNVAIIGMGLIGGSAAKAYSTAGHEVYAFDRDKAVVDFAMLAGDCKAAADESTLGTCELVLIALPPQASCLYLQENCQSFAKNSVIIDLCGVKREICEIGFELAEKNGFVFIGGHPMAGSQNSGYKHSRAELFHGASMIVVPPRADDMALLYTVKQLLAPMGFGKITVTTAGEHDRVIAYASHLTHIVSNAFVKNPTASAPRGFTAGSFRDMTRVAAVDPSLWSELFVQNADNLLTELEVLMHELERYRMALTERDAGELYQLLAEGKLRKESQICAD